MTCVTNQQTQGPCPNYGFNASTNQISNSNFTYDAAGNLTADGTGTGSHTYQWDGENRLTSIDSGSTATYTYNALGQRVEKKVGSAYTEYMFDGSGEPVGENNRTSWSVSVVPFGGRHLAHYQGSATYFMHGNHLGSTSQATDYSGAMAQDQLYYPWGGDWNMVGTAQEKRFASLQHRDTTETGLDPTLFRMFSSTQGRWLSTDPARGCGDNPQNLNRYAYAGNSPTNRTDPRGDLYCDFFGCYCDWSDPFCGYGYYYSGSLAFVSVEPAISGLFGLKESLFEECLYKNCHQWPLWDNRSACNYILLGRTPAHPLCANGISGVFIPISIDVVIPFTSYALHFGVCTVKPGIALSYLDHNPCPGV